MPEDPLDRLNRLQHEFMAAGSAWDNPARLLAEQRRIQDELRQAALAFFGTEPRAAEIPSAPSKNLTPQQADGVRRRLERALGRAQRIREAHARSLGRTMVGWDRGPRYLRSLLEALDKSEKLVERLWRDYGEQFPDRQPPKRLDPWRRPREQHDPQELWRAELKLRHGTPAEQQAARRLLGRGVSPHQQGGVTTTSGGGRPPTLSYRERVSLKAAARRLDNEIAVQEQRLRAERDIEQAQRLVYSLQDLYFQRDELAAGLGERPLKGRRPSNWVLFERLAAGARLEPTKRLGTDPSVVPGGYVGYMEEVRPRGPFGRKVRSGRFGEYQPLPPASAQRLAQLDAFLEAASGRSVLRAVSRVPGYAEVTTALFGSLPAGRRGFGDLDPHTGQLLQRQLIRYGELLELKELAETGAPKLKALHDAYQARRKEWQHEVALAQRYGRKPRMRVLDGAQMRELEEANRYEHIARQHGIYNLREYSFKHEAELSQLRGALRGRVGEALQGKLDAYARTMAQASRAAETHDQGDTRWGPTIAAEIKGELDEMRELGAVSFGDFTFHDVDDPTEFARSPQAREAALSRILGTTMTEGETPMGRALKERSRRYAGQGLDVESLEQWRRAAEVGTAQRGGSFGLDERVRAALSDQPFRVAMRGGLSLDLRRLRKEGVRKARQWIEGDVGYGLAMGYDARGAPGGYKWLVQQARYGSKHGMQEELHGLTDYEAATIRQTRIRQPGVSNLVFNDPWLARTVRRVDARIGSLQGMIGKGKESGKTVAPDDPYFARLSSRILGREMPSWVDQAMAPPTRDVFDMVTELRQTKANLLAQAARRGSPLLDERGLPVVDERGLLVVEDSLARAAKAPWMQGQFKGVSFRDPALFDVTRMGTARDRSRFLGIPGIVGGRGAPYSVFKQLWGRWQRSGETEPEYFPGSFEEVYKASRGLPVSTPQAQAFVERHGPLGLADLAAEAAARFRERLLPDLEGALVRQEYAWVERGLEVRPRARVSHVGEDAYDVYIGRGKGPRGEAGVWGNPFPIDEEYTREASVAAYEEYLLKHKELWARLPELQGKTLGCFCSPQACHGDVLALYANAYSGDPQAIAQLERRSRGARGALVQEFLETIPAENRLPSLEEAFADASAAVRQRFRTPEFAASQLTADRLAELFPDLPIEAFEDPKFRGLLIEAFKGEGPTKPPIRYDPKAHYPYAVFKFPQKRAAKKGEPKGSRAPSYRDPQTGKPYTLGWRGELDALKASEMQREFEQSQLLAAGLGYPYRSAQETLEQSRVGEWPEKAQILKSSQGFLRALYNWRNRVVEGAGLLDAGGERTNLRAFISAEGRRERELATGENLAVLIEREAKLKQTIAEREAEMAEQVRLLNEQAGPGITASLSAWFRPQGEGAATIKVNNWQLASGEDEFVPDLEGAKKYIGKTFVKVRDGGQVARFNKTIWSLAGKNPERARAIQNLIQEYVRTRWIGRGTRFTDEERLFMRGSPLQRLLSPKGAEKVGFSRQDIRDYILATDPDRYDQMSRADALLALHGGVDSRGERIYGVSELIEQERQELQARRRGARSLSDYLEFIPGLGEFLDEEAQLSRSMAGRAALRHRRHWGIRQTGLSRDKKLLKDWAETLNAVWQVTTFDPTRQTKGRNDQTYAKPFLLPWEWLPADAKGQERWKVVDEFLGTAPMPIERAKAFISGIVNATHSWQGRGTISSANLRKILEGIGRPADEVERVLALVGEGGLRRKTSGFAFPNQIDPQFENYMEAARLVAGARPQPEETASPLPPKSVTTPRSAPARAPGARAPPKLSLVSARDALAYAQIVQKLAPNALFYNLTSEDLDYATQLPGLFAPGPLSPKDPAGVERYVEQLASSEEFSQLLRALAKAEQQQVLITSPGQGAFLYPFLKSLGLSPQIYGLSPTGKSFGDQPFPEKQANVFGKSEAYRRLLGRFGSYRMGSSIDPLDAALAASQPPAAVRPVRSSPAASPAYEPLDPNDPRSIYQTKLYPEGKDLGETLRTVFGDKLTTEQLYAALYRQGKHGAGPLVVEAPAGTGKTHTIMARTIGQMLLGDPASILNVTFTKQAGDEMMLRLTEQIYGDRKKGIGGISQIQRKLNLSEVPYYGRTIHSVAYDIVRDAYRYRDEGVVGLHPKYDPQVARPSVVDAEAADELLGETMQSLGVGPRFLGQQAGWEQRREVRRLIDDAKDAGLDPARYRQWLEQEGRDTPEALRVAEVYEHYQRALAERGQLDFGDLLRIANTVLEKSDVIKALWKNRFKHINVDEFQDVRGGEWRLINNLATDLAGKKLVADLAYFGDTMQAIFGFREAHPEGFGTLQRAQNLGWIPHDVVEHALTLNQRSRPELVLGAQAISSAVRDRGERVDPRRANQRGFVTLHAIENPEKMKQQAALTVWNLIHRGGVDPKDILVTSRIDSYLFGTQGERGVVQLLSDRDSPYYLGDEIPVRFSPGEALKGKHPETTRDWAEAYKEWLATPEDERQGVVATNIHKAKGLGFEYVVAVGVGANDMPRHKAGQRRGDVWRPRTQEELEELKTFYTMWTRAAKGLMIFYPEHAGGEGYTDGKRIGPSAYLARPIAAIRQGYGSLKMGRGLAVGSRDTAAGIYTVGEHGPETVILPKGAQVVSSADRRLIANQAYRMGSDASVDSILDLLAETGGRSVAQETIPEARGLEMQARRLGVKGKTPFPIYQTEAAFRQWQEGYARAKQAGVEFAMRPSAEQSKTLGHVITGWYDVPDEYILARDAHSVEYSRGAPNGPHMGHYHVDDDAARPSLLDKQAMLQRLNDQMAMNQGRYNYVTEFIGNAQEQRAYQLMRDDAGEYKLHELPIQMIRSVAEETRRLEAAGISYAKNARKWLPRPAETARVAPQEALGVSAGVAEQLGQTGEAAAVLELPRNYLDPSLTGWAEHFKAYREDLRQSLGLSARQAAEKLARDAASIWRRVSRQGELRTSASGFADEAARGEILKRFAQQVAIAQQKGYEVGPAVLQRNEKGTLEIAAAIAKAIKASPVPVELPDAQLSEFKQWLGVGGEAPRWAKEWADQGFKPYTNRSVIENEALKRLYQMRQSFEGAPPALDPESYRVGSRLAASYRMGANTPPNPNQWNLWWAALNGPPTSGIGGQPLPLNGNPVQLVQPTNPGGVPTRGIFGDFEEALRYATGGWTGRALRLSSAMVHSGFYLSYLGDVARSVSEPAEQSYVTSDAQAVRMLQNLGMTPEQLGGRQGTVARRERLIRFAEELGSQEGWRGTTTEERLGAGALLSGRIGLRWSQYGGSQPVAEGLTAAVEPVAKMSQALNMNTLEGLDTVFTLLTQFGEMRSIRELAARGDFAGIKENLNRWTDLVTQVAQAGGDVEMLTEVGKYVGPQLARAGFAPEYYGALIAETSKAGLTPRQVGQMLRDTTELLTDATAQQAYALRRLVAPQVITAAPEWQELQLVAPQLAQRGPLSLEEMQHGIEGLSLGIQRRSVQQQRLTLPRRQELERAQWELERSQAQQRIAAARLDLELSAPAEYDLDGEIVRPAGPRRRLQELSLESRQIELQTAQAELAMRPQIRALQREYQTAQLGYQWQSLNRAQASLNFNTWYNRQLHGTPNQQAALQIAGASWQQAQLGAGRSETNQGMSFAPTPLSATGANYGLAGEQFVASLEHQRSQLFYSRSRLMSGAAFQENIEYLDKQKEFFERQAQLEEAAREFQRQANQEQIDAQRGMLEIQQRLSDKEMELQQKRDEREALLLGNQVETLTQQQAAAQAELQLADQLRPIVEGTLDQQELIEGLQTMPVGTTGKTLLELQQEYESGNLSDQEAIVALQGFMHSQLKPASFGENLLQQVPGLFENGELRPERFYELVAQQSEEWRRLGYGPEEMARERERFLKSFTGEEGRTAANILLDIESKSPGELRRLASQAEEERLARRAAGLTSTDIAFETGRGGGKGTAADLTTSFSNLNNKIGKELIPSMANLAGSTNAAAWAMQNIPGVKEAVGAGIPTMGTLGGLSGALSVFGSLGYAASAIMMLGKLTREMHLGGTIVGAAGRTAGAVGLSSLLGGGAAVGGGGTLAGVGAAALPYLALLALAGGGAELLGVDWVGKLTGQNQGELLRERLNIFGLEMPTAYGVMKGQWDDFVGGLQAWGIVPKTAEAAEYVEPAGYLPAAGQGMGGLRAAEAKMVEAARETQETLAKDAGEYRETSEAAWAEHWEEKLPEAVRAGEDESRTSAREYLGAVYDGRSGVLFDWSLSMVEYWAYLWQSQLPASIRAGEGPLGQAIDAYLEQAQARLASFSPSFASVPGGMTGGPVSGNWSELINEAAARYGVDPALVKAVIQQESGGNPNALSPMGATGLMQLMPETAAGLGVTNPWDPRQNVFGGTNYLKQLLNTYGGNVQEALAAYNGGAGAVAALRAGESWSETKAYLGAVMSYYEQYKAGDAPLGSSAGPVAGGPKIEINLNQTFNLALEEKEKERWQQETIELIETALEPYLT